jgi:hypothetical protein
VIAWARSPEELEMLFEDACVLHDREALAGLFDPGAGRRFSGSGPGGDRTGSGHQHDRRFLGRRRNLLGLPARVLQSGPTALLIAGRSIHVARRAPVGWRYLISWWVN